MNGEESCAVVVLEKSVCAVEKFVVVRWFLKTKSGGERLAFCRRAESGSALVQNVGSCTAADQKRYSGRFLTFTFCYSSDVADRLEVVYCRHRQSILFLQEKWSLGFFSGVFGIFSVTKTGCT